MTPCIRLLALVAALVIPSVCALQAFAQTGAPKPLSAVFDPKYQALLSAEVAAKVDRVAKELGQKFEKGELLIQLDEGAYRPNLQKNQAAATAAAKGLEVTQKLFADKTASPLDLENARKDMSMATAGAQMAQKELSSCKVLAPFPGRVKKVYVHPHEWVDKGRPLIEVVDDRVLTARILLPSSMFGKVRIGQQIPIEVAETGAQVTGAVTHVGEVLDPASSTFEISADVDNAADTLRAGMTGRAALPAEAAK